MASFDDDEDSIVIHPRKLAFARERPRARPILRNFSQKFEKNFRTRERAKLKILARDTQSSRQIWKNLTQRQANPRALTHQSWKFWPTVRAWAVKIKILAPRQRRRRPLTLPQARPDQAHPKGRARADLTWGRQNGHLAKLSDWGQSDRQMAYFGPFWRLDQNDHLSHLPCPRTRQMTNDQNGRLRSA